jgi:hypothetical protein
MPSTNRAGGTRRWRRLVAFVLERDQRICWRCGHPGADTGGHVIAVDLRPELEYDPTNVRAEHGRRRTVAVDGFECIGNYAAGATPPPTTAVRSRVWR